MLFSKNYLEFRRNYITKIPPTKFHLALLGAATQFDYASLRMTPIGVGEENSKTNTIKISPVGRKMSDGRLH